METPWNGETYVWLKSKKKIQKRKGIAEEYSYIIEKVSIWEKNAAYVKKNHISSEVIHLRLDKIGEFF